MTDLKPLEPAAKLIQSLERFYEMTAQGMTVKAYHAGLDYLGADLQTIQDTATRAQAIRLFHHLGGGAHVVSRDPKMAESQVLPTIRALIDLLKEKLPRA